MSNLKQFIKTYQMARNVGNTIRWSLNDMFWKNIWFYRNIFPYGYKLGRGLFWRKI